MYFLWRNKPRAVLGIDKTWIPATELDKKMDKVMAFTTAEGARIVQQENFQHASVSVINRKTFQQKAKIKTLPVFKTVDVESRTQDSDEAPHMLYADYLDKLCAQTFPGDSQVVFPPANLKDTFDTPLIEKIRGLLGELQQSAVALPEEEARLRDEIKQLDLLTADRIHQAEMYSLTDEESVYFVKELRNSRIARRRRKNELAAVLVAKDILQMLEKTDLKDAVRELDKLGKQEYHCRVLSEKDEIVKHHQS